MSMKREIVTTIALLSCAFVGHLGAADKIKINVRLSDAAIRQQLLQLTPLGSSMLQVSHFLEQGLYRESSVVDGPPGHPLSGLWVDIGHYHEPRSFAEGLFLFPTVVHAYWDFDKKNKLRNIQVRRGVMAW